MALQHPLARVRGLGSAKAGAAHWWAQRITAVALVPLTIWFIVSVVGMAAGDYGAVKAWLAAPVNAILMVLFVIATFHHLQLGVQVVIEDYIHCEVLKIASLIAVKLASFGLAVAALFSILKVAFGG